jgi:hypothetical protein
MLDGNGRDGKKGDGWETVMPCARLKVRVAGQRGGRNGRRTRDGRREPPSKLARLREVNPPPKTVAAKV